MDRTPPGSATNLETRPDDVAARNTLRLVRLRLTLALIATAILPIAVAAPVIRFATDDTRIIHSARQEALSAALSNAAGVVAAGAVADLTVAAADPVISRMADRPKRGDEESATAVLAGLTRTAPGATASAAILGPAGEERLRVGDALIPWPREETPASLVRSQGGGAWHLVLTVPIASADDGPSPGAVAAALPLADLLATAIAGTTHDRHAVRFVDPSSGRTLASSDRSIDASVLSDRVIGLATDLGSSGTARAPVVVAGLTALAVEVADPFPVTSLPLPALLSLIGLIGLLIAVVIWMARQILRPAVELDASRTRLRLAYAEAREVALRDSLTGLGNHRAFQEEFTAILDQARRYGHPMSLVLIDIDEFKLVNDSAGHAVGDDLLAEVARLLRQVSRTADRAFRIGGDEFALLLTHTDGDGALQLARRLLAAGLEIRPHGRYVEPISFSAGVSAFPAFGTTREELHQQADAALYRSKRSGRTAVNLVDPAIDELRVDDHRRAALSAAIARVVTERTVRPVYQPIVHVSTGRVIGFEGLVRPGAATGFSGPAGLFETAALVGRTVELDLVCLETVVNGAVGIPDPLLATINISPRTLEAAEFGSSRLLSLLDRAGIAPDRIILELTEQETIDDVARVKSVLDRCRAAGIRIAADDVGAGNAGLRLLSQIRFDVVKIDLSLVHGGAGRETVREVLGSIVDLARRWEALVVAEGVETTDQLRLIRELGVDAAQGYLLGRPAEQISIERIDVDAILAAADRPYARLGLDIGAQSFTQPVSVG